MPLQCPSLWKIIEIQEGLKGGFLELFKLILLLTQDLCRNILSQKTVFPALFMYLSGLEIVCKDMPRNNFPLPSKDFFGGMSPDISDYIKSAESLSKKSKHNFISVEHLLGAFLQNKNSLLRKHHKDLKFNWNKKVMEMLQIAHEVAKPHWKDILVTPRLQNLWDEAVERTRYKDSLHIKEVHLMWTLIAQEDSYAYKWLKNEHLVPESFVVMLKNELEQESGAAAAEEKEEAPATASVPAPAPAPTPAPAPAPVSVQAEVQPPEETEPSESAKAASKPFGGLISKSSSPSGEGLMKKKQPAQSDSDVALDFSSGSGENTLFFDSMPSAGDAGDAAYNAAAGYYEQQPSYGQETAWPAAQETGGYGGNDAYGASQGVYDVSQDIQQQPYYQTGEAGYNAEPVYDTGYGSQQTAYESRQPDGAGYGAAADDSYGSPRQGADAAYYGQPTAQEYAPEQAQAAAEVHYTDSPEFLDEKINVADLYLYSVGELRQRGVPVPVLSELVVLTKKYKSLPERIPYKTSKLYFEEIVNKGLSETEYMEVLDSIRVILEPSLKKAAADSGASKEKSLFKADKSVMGSLAAVREPEQAASAVDAPFGLSSEEISSAINDISIEDELDSISSLGLGDFDRSAEKVLVLQPVDTSNLSAFALATGIVEHFQVRESLEAAQGRYFRGESEAGTLSILWSRMYNNFHSVRSEDKVGPVKTDETPVELK